jgi:hypothetical protein
MPIVPNDSLTAWSGPYWSLSTPTCRLSLTVEARDEKTLRDGPWQASVRSESVTAKRMTPEMVTALPIGNMTEKTQEKALHRTRFTSERPIFD